MEKNTKKSINNNVYRELGERWYEAQDDPVALLRAESRFRNPWIGGVISQRLGSAKVLDLGCGAGFLSNELALQGHRVWGLDQASEALQVAARFDQSKSVVYQQGDAYETPFSSSCFDVVCAMDFLEHVEDPNRLISEVARVLKPFGLFFFATFNRNLISHLLVIKAVEWFIKNTPKDLHVIDLFIKPEELREMCLEQGLRISELHGVKPKILSRAGFNTLSSGCVDPQFSFSFSGSKVAGYMGYAVKESH